MNGSHAEAKIHLDRDVPDAPLTAMRVAMIGYGSQGRAHALNLRDSGFDVVVGVREGSQSISRAQAEGMEVSSIADACASSGLVALMIPDQHQAEAYRTSIEPNLSPGTGLLFAHGFNILYGQIEPPSDSDVILVGPKAPGPVVRTTYEAGGGVPALIAVHKDVSGRALNNALAYAKGIGCTRAGAIETTFEEETITDLFGEQAVLAGGASALVKLGFETLVEAGYQPEVAYFECLHELKLVVDIMQQQGIAGMGRAISDTAEYGSLTRGREVLGASVRKAMIEVLRNIESGDFAREWIAESGDGGEKLQIERSRAAEHPIEQVGRALRNMMSSALPPKKIGIDRVTSS